MALATTFRIGARTQFVNGSSNVTSYQSTFPGGTPATKTEVEPLIQYENVGTYDVTLIANNNKG